MKKEVDISKYIEDLEGNKITISKIASDEGVSRDTIYKYLDKYYADLGKERPSFLPGKRIVDNFDISIYIDDLKNRRITLKKVAELEKTTIQIVKTKIKRYYASRNEEMPNYRELDRVIDINVEQYIPALEAGEITLEEIIKKEGINRSLLLRRIDRIYEQSGKSRPKLKIGRKSSFDMSYIEAYKNGEMTIDEIVEKTGLTESTIDQKIREYYKSIGQERPRKSRDLSKYIEIYEKGELSVTEIAGIEEIELSRVSKWIIRYYRKLGKTDLEIKKMKEDIGKKRKKILKDREKVVLQAPDFDAYKRAYSSNTITRYTRMVTDYGFIEKYMLDYKNGLISPYTIAIQEKMSIRTIKNALVHHFVENDEPLLKYLQITEGVVSLVTIYLKKGLTKEKIQEIARKKASIIPDEVFQIANLRIIEELDAR